MNRRAGGGELGKRVLTGVIGGAALVSLIVFGGHWGGHLLGLILTLGMVHEFADITLSLPDRAEKRWVAVLLAVAPAAVFYFAPVALFNVWVGVFLCLFAYFLFAASRYQGTTLLGHTQEMMFLGFGLFYLAGLPLFLPALRNLPDGLHWLIVFLLINWAGDTGAYFTGKKFGRHKLYKLISPKKTIEGSVGGLALGLAIVFLYRELAFPSMSVQVVLIASFGVGIVAQIGDLAESMLKRAFNRKDSGAILPGHGGFLDRFDGVVFSLPVMYACVRLFG